MAAFQLTEGWFFYFRSTSELMTWMGFDPALNYLQIAFTDDTEITYSGITQGVAQSLFGAGNNSSPNATTPDQFYLSAIKDSYPVVLAS